MEDPAGTRPGRRRGQKTRLSLDYTTTAAEQLRASVLSRHFARLASKRDAVINLRARLFGGRRLTRKQAQDLLDQQGPRYLSSKWYESKGIPLLAHRSSCVDPTTGSAPVWATREMVLRFEWNGGSLDVPDASLSMANATIDGLELVLPRGKVSIAQGSVLDEIRVVASDLARHYDWAEGAANLFVMTGDPPPMFAIGFRSVGGYRDDHHHFAFDLRIEPWVSPDSVKRAFLQLQRDAYGRSHRRLEDRALMLFEFIERLRERRFHKSWREMKEHNLDFSWTEAAKLWNENFVGPFRPYEPSGMSRDFERTFYALIRPPIKPRYAQRVKAKEREGSESK